MQCRPKRYDRAYAAYACRNDATCLYLSRPNTKGFDNIKVGKGSTAFKSAHIAAVNKFRNAMVGKADYFTTTGNACSITRKDGGAVIVMKGSGNISIANGGGYCPAGTYTDMVSGNEFTVTTTTISGNVGSSGIAVIMDGAGGGGGGGGGGGTTTSDLYILGNLEGAAGWSTTPGTGIAMTGSGTTYTATGVKFVAAAGETTCYFNLTDKVGATWDELNQIANRYGAATEGETITLGTASTIVKYALNVDASGCLSWSIAPGTYDITADLSSMKLTVVNTGGGGGGGGGTTTDLTIPGDYNIAYSGSHTKIYYWGGDSKPEWPGVEMTSVTGSDGKTYKCYKVPAGTTGVIFCTNGDSDKTGDLTYTGSYVMDNNGATSTKVTFSGGGGGGGGGTTTDITIAGDYNLAYNGSHSKVYYWGGDSKPEWPGVEMASATGSDGKTYKCYKVPSGTTGIIFNTNGDNDKTGDLTYTGSYVMDNNGATSIKVTFTTDPIPTKPVVTANPASGTFKSSVTVTLTVSPEATIYYTTNGSAATTSSAKYSSPLTFTETTTLNTLAVTADGVQNAQTFTYTKQGDTPVPVPGTNLITDYYKVNPDGKVGTNKTINVTGHPASNAFSNWTDAELIAQGVARDVAQAFRGLHERPIVDSYSLYAAYDNDNLYLGVQFVYTVWDLGGEGKQPGESKPYNMDGHMVWAFDLDPDKSFDGYIGGTGPIWNEQAKGAKFNNGVDAVLMCSTKPGTGTPGFFIPTPDGHASYDAAYCKGLPSGFYGYTDGLHPSISHIWGQELGSDPEALKGNTGFVDLKGEIAESAHTFYEFKIPLSILGVTADYIRNTGIGVMYCDKYGTSPVGGTPYDPAYFDNVYDEYSYGDNTSAEKEDEDVITYSPARIGKLGGGGSGVTDIATSGNGMKVYAAGGKLYIEASEATTVNITTLSGVTISRKVEAGVNVIDDLARGFYIVGRVKVAL